MNFDKETQEKIQELQMYEQNLNNILMQRQTFQIELTETDNALLELEKSGGDVYKMVGKIMIKSDKSKIEKDLKHKKDLLNLRINSINKQDEELTTKMEKIRDEVMKKLK